MTAPADAPLNPPADIRVIIVNYNAGAVLARVVTALLAQTRGDFELVVADNGSTDGSLDEIPSDPRARVQRNGANLGFAAANNRAAAGFRGRWIATLNPDAIPATDWLERLVAAAEADPAVKLAGSTQYIAEQPHLFDGTGDCLSLWGFAWRGNHRHPAVEPPPEGEPFGPCAAAALYDRALFEKLGGFDERFFCYAEDVDLAFRFRLAGARCRQVAAARVLHVGGVTSATNGHAGRFSPFAAYHGFRNQIWLLIKNMPAPFLPFSLAGHLALLAVIMLTRDPRRATILRGAVAAFRDLGPVLTQRRARAPRAISLAELARHLVVNPMKWRRRSACLRPLPVVAR